MTANGAIGHSASVVQDNRRRPCNRYCMGKKGAPQGPPMGRSGVSNYRRRDRSTSHGGKNSTGHKVRFIGVIGIARIIAGRFVGVGRKARHEANVGFNHRTAAVGGFNVWIAGCHGSSLHIARNAAPSVDRRIRRNERAACRRQERNRWRFEQPSDESINKGWSVGCIDRAIRNDGVGVTWSRDETR